MKQQAVGENIIFGTVHGKPLQVGLQSYHFKIIQSTCIIFVVGLWKKPILKWIIAFTLNCNKLKSSPTILLLVEKIKGTLQQKKTKKLLCKKISLSWTVRWISMWHESESCWHVKQSIHMNFTNISASNRLDLSEMLQAPNYTEFTGYKMTHGENEVGSRYKKL